VGGVSQTDSTTRSVRVFWGNYGRSGRPAIVTPAALEASHPLKPLPPAQPLRNPQPMHQTHYGSNSMPPYLAQVTCVCVCAISWPVILLSDTGDHVELEY
jgi:hypothetical protein